MCEYQAQRLAAGSLPGPRDDERQVPGRFIAMHQANLVLASIQQKTREMDFPCNLTSATIQQKRWEMAACRRYQLDSEN